jgi:hypothetical protein
MIDKYKVNNKSTIVEKVNNNYNPDYNKEWIIEIDSSNSIIPIVSILGQSFEISTNVQIVDIKMRCNVPHTEQSNNKVGDIITITYKENNYPSEICKDFYVEYFNYQDLHILLKKYFDELI